MSIVHWIKWKILIIKREFNLIERNLVTTENQKLRDCVAKCVVCLFLNKYGQISFTNAKLYITYQSI